MSRSSGCLQVRPLGLPRLDGACSILAQSTTTGATTAQTAGEDQQRPRRQPPERQRHHDQQAVEGQDDEHRHVVERPEPEAERDQQDGTDQRRPRRSGTARIPVVHEHERDPASIANSGAARPPAMHVPHGRVPLDPVGPEVRPASCRSGRSRGQVDRLDPSGARRRRPAQSSTWSSMPSAGGEPRRPGGPCARWRTPGRPSRP